MLRASLRGLFARKLRLTLAVVAVVLGVSFLSGAFVLSDSLTARFKTLFASVNENVDVQVMLTDEAAEEDPPPRITQQQLDAMEDVTGVAAVSGDVSALGVVPFDRIDGKPVTTTGAPQVGVGVAGDDPFKLVSLAEGKWPSSDGQIALTRYTAEQAHAGLDDRVKVFLPVLNQAREFTVVGIAVYSGNRDSLAGETMVMLPQSQAQQIFFGQTGVYSGAFFGADEGVSQDELRNRIAPLVPAGYAAKTGEQANKDSANDVQEGLSQFTTYLLGPFAIVALIVGIFLIFNTFNIVVAQRARELALMRTLGASWRQVTGSVMVEALLVGFVGSTLGLLAGIGLGIGGGSALTSLLDVQLPGSGIVVGVLPVVLAYVVGIGVTLVAAFIPAIKASGVPPLAALREIARPDKPLRGLSIVGLAFAVPGGALVALALAGMGDFTLPGLLLGVGLVFLGVALLSPLLTRPLAGLIGRALAWGVTGKLGVRNALRNPRRTAVTAAALMIGVTLVSTASVLGASFKTSINEIVNSSVGAEIIVQTNQTQGPPTGETGFAPEAMDRVRTLPGVERTVTFFVTVDARIEGQQNQFTGLIALDDVGAARQMFSMQAVEGEVRDLTSGELVTDENTAKARGWKVGSDARIALTKGGEQTYKVVGIYKSTPIWTDSILLPRSAVTYFGGPLANQGYVALADGADAARVTAEVERIMSDYPLVSVGDRSSLLDQFAGFVDTALGIISVLLGVAIVIALLGILNTLLLSIYERTRELGLLRAVGLGRGGVTRMVGTESVVMAVFGCVLGVVLGVGLGVAIAAALIDRDFLSTISIPWGSLVVFVVLAAVAGVLAALWPAARAARLNVLEAIAYE